jgi:hypothetical protein
MSSLRFLHEKKKSNLFASFASVTKFVKKGLIQELYHLLLLYAIQTTLFFPLLSLMKIYIVAQLK